MVNDFQLYEILCEMSKLAGQYKDGQECSLKIRECADRIASQLYRVAVIGEFKRGKSSMINALLGTEILPTSILPMTAVITRVTYGEEKRIVINYKDGAQEDATIEQLIDFATKYDEEKAARASTIKEIVVYYPSVFCKNHIELIDTPGMNDNEDMTAVTLGVVGDIDAAIVVISAQEPLSVTEQELVLTMIAEQGIHHIVFVVTHIDAVSDDPEDQDRIISFITERINGGLLKRAEETFKGKDSLIRKSHKILEAPDIFGVSSVLAMQGFMHDSEKILKKSRFPKFKKELLTLLTAAQSADVRLNARDHINRITENIVAWHDSEIKYLTEARNDIIAFQKKYELYFLNSEKSFNTIITSLDNMICTLGLDPIDSASAAKFIQTSSVKKFRDISGKYRNSLYEVEDKIKEIFISHLYTVKTSDYSNASVTSALVEALKEAHTEKNRYKEEIISKISGQIDTAFASYASLRPVYEGSETEKGYAAELESLMNKWRADNSFPVLTWILSPIPELDELVGVDIIPHIKSVIIKSFEKYSTDIREYIDSWKAIMTEYHKKIYSDRSICALLVRELSENGTRRSVLEIDQSKHMERISEIRDMLSDKSGSFSVESKVAQ